MIAVDSFNWQSILWSVPNAYADWWTWISAVMAFLAAVLMFLRTVMREHWNALVFFRSLYIFGLFLIFAAALNSGWQRWIEPVFAISGLGMALIYYFDLHHIPPRHSICRNAWIRLFGKERVHQ